MKFGVLPQAVSLMKLMLNFFRTINIQDRELFSCHFIEYTLEPICFKSRIMLDTTKLYSMVPVRITLTFTPGHMVTEKLGLVQAFCCEVV